MPTLDLIFLADNEWGNQLMREVAQEWFAAHPDSAFVTVYEHAGWTLTFHRADLECVGSANDQAVFRTDRPLPTVEMRRHGVSHRRPVTRPDLKEITSLADYQKPRVVNHTALCAALGLQPGEDYGAAETCHTHLTQYQFRGRPFEVFYDEAACIWRAWAQGFGGVSDLCPDRLLPAMHQFLESKLRLLAA